MHPVLVPLSLPGFLGGCSDTGVTTFNANPDAEITSHGDGQELLEGYTERFRGAVVHLGAIGLLTRVTLDVVPTFDVVQHVYRRLEHAALEANFDAILATAAPDHVPAALVEQLATGARLVIPVGRFRQEMTIVTKTDDGTTTQTTLPVRFVPMTGEARDR